MFSVKYSFFLKSYILFECIFRIGMKFYRETETIAVFRRLEGFTLAFYECYFMYMCIYVCIYAFT